MVTRKFQAMEEAPQLFDNVPQARSSDPATSKEADQRNRRLNRQTQCGRVVLYLYAVEAASADDLDRALGWAVSTAGKRLPDLKRGGWIEATGQMRSTVRGSDGRVWRLTQNGIEWARNVNSQISGASKPTRPFTKAVPVEVQRQDAALLSVICDHVARHGDIAKLKARMDFEHLPDTEIKAWLRRQSRHLRGLS